MASDSEDLVLSISADTRQIMNAMKRLERQMSGSTSQMEKQFSGVGKAIDKAMPTGMQERINKMVGAQSAATKEWIGALAEQGKEMDKLRAKFNPMFSTITSYKTAVREIQTAHRLGAISADEMASAIQRERQAALSSIAALKQRKAALMDTPNARGGNFNTSNLAAQGFDVAATAAFMPWYTVALQQGPQVAQVFNDIRASGQAIGPAVAGAFMQILNPVSLLTIGTIGLTAAAVQYFTSTDEGSETSQKRLIEEEQLIQRVAQAWGDVLPAIRAVATERERLAGKKDIEDSTRQQAEKVFGAIKGEVQGAGDAILAVMDQLRHIVPPEQLSAVQAQLAGLANTAAKSETSVAELEAAQRSLAELGERYNIPVFRETADAIQSVIPRLDEVMQKTVELAQERGLTLAFNDLQAAISSVSSAKARGELDELMQKAREGEISVVDLLAELGRISGYAPDVSSIISQFRAITEAAEAARKASAGIVGAESKGGRTRYGGVGYNPNLPDNPGWTREDRPLDDYFMPKPAGSSRKAKAPVKTADDRFFESLEEIRQRTVALIEEKAQIGLTYEAQVKRKTAFDLEQQALKQVREEARKKGDQDWQNAQLTPEQIRQIDEVSAAYARQAAELKNAQQQQQALEHLFEMGGSALMSIVDKSASAEEALKKLIIQLALAAAQAALLGSGPLAGLFSGFGGLGGRAGGGDPWAGMRERGGPVSAGKAYVVGEKRPELFVPNTSGRILPQVPSLMLGRSNGAIQITYAPNYSADNASAEAVAKLSEMRNRDRAEMPAVIIQTIKEAQKRRML